jgi:hypothetical protein
MDPDYRYAPATGHEAAAHMFDTSVVRVHQQEACVPDNDQQNMGRSRGGVTSKIRVVADAYDLLVHVVLTRRRRKTTGSARFFQGTCFPR